MLVAGSFFSTVAPAQSDTVFVRTTTTETISSGTYQTLNTNTLASSHGVVKTSGPVDEESGDENTSFRKTEFGLRYYPTFSSLKVRTYSGEVVDGTFTMGEVFGAFIGHNFNRHLGLVL